MVKNSKSNRPLVSIIIPVYNTEKYLKRCLDSVINQTLKNIEIIIVNDGSPDNSNQIIDQYAKLDQRIVVINQENQGLGLARNSGIDIAKGEYISFIDSDDWVELNFLEVMYIEAQKGNYDFVQCAIKFIYSNSELISHSVNQYIENNIFEQFVESKIISETFWNKLFKRKCFSTLRFSHFYYEDYELAMRLYPIINSVSLIPEALYNYRQREGSIVNTFTQKHIDDIVIITKNLKQYFENPSNNCIQYLKPCYSYIDKVLTYKIAQAYSSKIPYRNFKKLLSLFSSQRKTLSWRIKLILTIISIKYPLLYQYLILIYHTIKRK